MIKRRMLLLIILLFTLCCSMILSVSFGTKSIQIEDILGAFGIGDVTTFGSEVVRARIPRTVFGVLAGAALAVSGGMMQSITRNPIADPSILGVNSGASLFVVCGIAFLHVNNNITMIWLAFVGATLTAFCVYGLASIGYSGATPLKLALAGAAAGTALQSMVNTVMMPDTQVMNQFRFWQTGSIGGATWNDIYTMLPFLTVGFGLSLMLSPALNTLALGDDMAVSLGINVFAVRLLGTLAGVLLCSATTALAGPIGFVGLMVPHLIRAVLGPDVRWVLPLSALAGAGLLILADVLGRLFGRPGELEVGIVTAILGAPVFVAIVRKVKVSTL
ncbi:MAG: iron ABC transporter permease [Acetatifactor sp.]|nr:iron ABC transporter permease [Acetatifactor sp.]